MVNTTKAAFASLPAEAVAIIDSFRNQRRQRPRRNADDDSRRLLYKYQRQVITLHRKVVATQRFDVALPPFPTLARVNDGEWADAVWAATLFTWFRMHYDT